MITMYQLKKYADKFLKETYNMELVVPLKLNGRLSRCCGRFVYFARSMKPKVVELNKFFVENNEPTVVLDVLRHELVHYALFMQGKPNSDGHPVFERELKRLGIVSQKTIDKYTIESKPKSVSVYKCAMPKCGKEYQTGRALKNEGIHHRCRCGGRLISLGKRVVAS